MVVVMVTLPNLLSTVVYIEIKKLMGHGVLLGVLKKSLHPWQRDACLASLDRPSFIGRRRIHREQKVCERVVSIGVSER